MCRLPTFIKSEMRSTEEFAGTVKTATSSAKQLAESYAKSASLIQKSAESLDFGIVDGEGYNKQMQKVAKNLGALNAVYELQLQGSSKAAETSDKLYQTMAQYLEKVNQISC